MSYRHARTRGFTLIEMAIVLVVIGLVVGAGLTAVSPIIAGTKTTATRTKMERIEAALLVHAIRNSCLPCPATTNSATGASTFVTETANCDANATPCTVEFGVVPWQELELPLDDILDGYNYRIGYGIARAIAGTSGMNRTGTNYAPLGTLTVNNTAGAAVTTQAAYVLVSFGQNSEGGFSRAGVAKAATQGSANEDENNDADTTYVQDQPIDVGGATHFDDIVVFRGKPLLVQMCGDGACGNPS
jgi:prepilin-type N-terminal cleavage/methylation domain-containing protein